MRTQLCFDNGWLFRIGDEELPICMQKGPVYSEAKTEGRLRGYAWRDYGKNREYQYDGWKSVDLPHDFIIEQEPMPTNNNTLGFFEYKNAWYRKHFKLDAADEGKRILLYFEGVATHATVYVNGVLMKHNFCGYTSFEVDITDIARFGDEENVAAVYVNTTDKHEGWWYSGGGIYRHVWLIKTDTVSVDLHGVYVHPEKLEDNVWNVPVDVTLRNDDGVRRSVTLKAELYFGDDIAAEMSGEADIECKYKTDVHMAAKVTSPMLWDCDTPNLYSCVVHIYENGNEIDTYETRFGFRTLRFDPDHGFFLNDRHTLIKGVCCHEDYSLQGKAASDSVKRLRLELLREMGANGYRMSHYCQSEQTFRYCSELGFLVMAETRWFMSTDEGLMQAEMLVKAHRNDPCVIMWSFGNEEPLHTTPIGKRIFVTMREHMRRLDNTRPFMTAVSNNPSGAPVMDEVDIIGVNYGLLHYDPLHEKYPDKMIFASECCAVASTRGWFYDDSPKRGYFHCYDNRGVVNGFFGREATWKFLTEREWIGGCYQWAGIEHRGETEWPRLCSQSGALDLFLQKKDAFYQNKSHWTDEPMVHMTPNMNLGGREGETIPFWVYTNCDEVELILDGVSLGRKNVGKYSHAEFEVVYNPGRLVCIGYRGGVKAAEQVYETTGEGVSLELELRNKHPLMSGDAAIYNCYVLDNEGRRVPDAENFVRFESSGGTIVGTGSDICDHTPVPSPDRKMRAGIIAVCVKVGSGGSVTLYARSQGLKPTALTTDITGK